MDALAIGIAQAVIASLLAAGIVSIFAMRRDLTDYQHRLDAHEKICELRYSELLKEVKELRSCLRGGR